MEFVDPDDEPQTFRRPPAPDDRVWRHPSEGVGPRLSGSSTSSSLASRRQLWTVGIASAVAASLFSTGLAVVAGTLLRQDTSTDAGVQRSSLVPLPVSLQSGGSALDVAQIAERVRPAITQLRVDKGSGGAGSGVMFRSDGHVLTNAHVVDGATAVTVVLSNGQELAGKVVGTDPESDTAVVKVEGGPFPTAELGTSADLKVGQPAIAIGSPLGLVGGPSVTAGVVSGLHRTVRTRNSAQVLMDMVQTDAPIAPGSSGGALLDAGGRVIGITTAVAVTDAGNDGFGFATSVDAARASAEQLVASGKVTAVWLGVEGSDLDGAMALELDLDGGAMVDKVKADSPAQRAGLAARDVIVTLDGRPLKGVGMLVVAVRTHRPGDVVTLEVVHDRQRHPMSVTVAERPVGS